MSRIKHVEVFQYSELSGVAKTRARDWWIQGSQFDPECEIDEFKTVLHALGFTATDKIFWDINPIKAAWLSSWTAERCMESMRVEAPALWKPTATNLPRRESVYDSHNCLRS